MTPIKTGDYGICHLKDNNYTTPYLIWIPLSLIISKKNFSENATFIIKKKP